MAPDVRLVPDAAQGQPGQLPVQGFGDGDGDRGLTHAGRARQTDDGRPALRVHLPHRQGLQNALLHLFQSEVILVQGLPNRLHAETLLRLRVPGHLQTHVQIVPDHRALGAAEGLLGQLRDLLQQVLLRVFRQLQLQDAAAVVLQLVVIVAGVSQLVLHDLDLGAEDLLPLGLFQMGPDLSLHLPLKAQHVVFVGQDPVQTLQPQVGVQLLQDLLLVLRPEIDVLGDVIRQIAQVPAVQDRGLHLLRHAPRLLGVLAEQVDGLAQQRLRPGAAGEGRRLFLLRNGLHVGLEIGRGLPQALQPRPGLALRHDPDGGGGGPQDLGDAGDRADLIEILLLGRGHADLPLGHQKDLLVRLHGVFQRPDGDEPLHLEAQVHMWENRQAPEGQNGNIQGYRFHGAPFRGVRHGCACAPDTRRMAKEGRRRASLLSCTGEI